MVLYVYIYITCGPPFLTLPQPLFEAFENDVMARYTPNLITGPKKILARFMYRGISTAVITEIGVTSIPYFSLFGGLIGSVTYWPCQVMRYGMPGLPYLLHLKHSQAQAFLSY